MNWTFDFAMLIPPFAGVGLKAYNGARRRFSLRCAWQGCWSVGSIN